MDGRAFGNGCRMGKGWRKKRRRDRGLAGGWHVNGRRIDGQMDEWVGMSRWKNGSRVEEDKRRKEGRREGRECGRSWVVDG